MNWLIIISITLLLAVIVAPFAYLLLRLSNEQGLEETDLKRIRVLQELEMIESMDDKSRKS